MHCTTRLMVCTAISIGIISTSAIASETNGETALNKATSEQPNSNMQTTEVPPKKRTKKKKSLPDCTRALQPNSQSLSTALSGKRGQFTLGRDNDNGGLGLKSSDKAIRGSDRVNGLGRSSASKPNPKDKKGKPTVRIGSGSSSGFCKKGDIRRVVGKKKKNLLKCYKKRLKEKPALRGKLTLRWTIGPNGKVGAVSPAPNNIGDSELGVCAGKVVKSMEFKKPQGGMCAVKWPFIFLTK